MATPPLWRAPLARGAVDAAVTLPGSKSLTNRYLVLAALAEGPSRLRAPLRSRDTLLMAAALGALGARVEDDGPEGSDWLLTPGELHGAGPVDCGLAGTVMRFVPPVAALARGRTVLDGDAAARSRPMGPLLGALRALGADVRDDAGHLPLVVEGDGALRGGQVALDASSSSQFVSALLLAGARTREGVLVRHEGPPLPSAPHVAMTLEVLASAGVSARAFGGDAWAVDAGPVSALDVLVEPDLSNAAPFLAAAVVTGGRVTVPGWPARTTQAGDELRDLLDAMGADVDAGREGLTVTGSGELYGLDADLHDVGELTPVLAALAVLAESPSSLHGIAHLRGHETDRLHALATELGGLGADVTETDDGLRIRPAALHGGVFATYGDHRLATAAAVVGLRVPGVDVVDVATTAKTLPDFPERWAAMLGQR